MRVWHSLQKMAFSVEYSLPSSVRWNLLWGGNNLNSPDFAKRKINDHGVKFPYFNGTHFMFRLRTLNNRVSFISVYSSFLLNFLFCLSHSNSAWQGCGFYRKMVKSKLKIVSLKIHSQFIQTYLLIPFSKCFTCDLTELDCNPLSFWWYGFSQILLTVCF